MATMNDDVDVGKIAVVGICGVIGVYVFITLTRVAFMQLEDEQAKIKLIDNKPRNLTKYQEEQEQKLGGGYRWSDEKARTVHMPIDVAMAKVTQELASQNKLERAPAAPSPEAPAAPTEATPAPADGQKKAKARTIPRP